MKMIEKDDQSSGSQMTYAVIFAILGLLIIFIAAGRLLFMRSSNDNLGWDSTPPLDVFDSPVPHHDQPVAIPQMATAVAAQGPPIPVTGLPEGWTMEQWQHYGQQYLNERDEL